MQHIIIAKIPSVINSVLWVESVESPGPVAYAHRQRSSALRAKTKQPGSLREIHYQTAGSLREIHYLCAFAPLR